MCAQIQSSMEESKAFLAEASIPGPDHRFFDSGSRAGEYAVRKSSSDGDTFFVAKVSRQDGTKLVSAAIDADQVPVTVTQMHRVGNSEPVLLEHHVGGEEYVAVAFTDGFSVRVLPVVRVVRGIDNKEQRGISTEGIGAYGPVATLSDDLMDYIQENILEAAVNVLRKRGSRYVGILSVSFVRDEADNVTVLGFKCG